MGLPHAIYMTTANITDRSIAINMVEYCCNVKKTTPSPENSGRWRLYRTKFCGYNPGHFKGRGWSCKAKRTLCFFCFSETLDCIAHLRLAWQISPTLEKLREIPSCRHISCSSALGRPFKCDTGDTQNQYPLFGARAVRHTVSFSICAINISCYFSFPVLYYPWWLNSFR